MDAEEIKEWIRAKEARVWFECGYCHARFPTSEDRRRHAEAFHAY